MSRAADRNRAEAEAIGIETVSHMIDGKRVEYRRVTCTSCGGKQECRHQFDAVTDAVRQNFEAKGWRITGRRSWVCPACARKKKIHPTIEPKEKTTMTLPQPAAARTMTPADRMKIREFLDGHYDEQRKCLLDGHTDQSAGEKLGLPWSWVRDIREAAYGPIETDPELIELKKQAADMQRDIDLLAGRHKLFVERIVAAEKRIGGKA